MKRVLILMFAVLLLGFSAKADHDQVITYNQLPTVAQELLKQHFADRVPLIVTVDWDDYTIVYE
ncbi:MAG: hypothetical protein J6X22_03715, partial [Muribaculaceae bacterium]|nr:hypothetical protein [Muribaculaceae bacterium]